MDEINTSRVMQEEVLFRWTAVARPFRKKGKEYMMVPVVISILVGLILLVAGEWVLIAVVVALVFAYYTWSVVPPEMSEYQLTTRGVRVAGKLYEWGVFSRWWISKQWEHDLLNLETPVIVTGKIVLPMGEENSENVEKVMMKYLLHEQPEDSGLDKAGKWLGKTFPMDEKVMSGNK